MPTLKLLFLSLTMAMLAACTPKTSPTVSKAGTNDWPGLRCSGTEPFWSVNIQSEGITWEAMGEMPLKYPAVDVYEKADKSLTWATKSGNSTLTIVLIPGACSDGMSEIEYPFQARVTLDGKEYQGCAQPNAATNPPGNDQ